MMRRVALSALAAAAALAPATRPRLVWNTTASAPIGLYRVAPEWSAARGTLVAVRPPAAMATWLDSRGYAPAGAVLIKRVAALWPSTVCRAGAVVTVDGEPAGLAIARGRRGETLPRWSGCRRLGPDEVFLLNAAPGSLDSRYFGPLPRAAILGRAVPLGAGVGR